MTNLFDQSFWSEPIPVLSPLSIHVHPIVILLMAPPSSSVQSGSGNGFSSPPMSADLRNLPLGQRLLRAGLLTRQQLAQALREQQQNHLRLGEICLDHGWIEPEDLYNYTASHEMCLGEVLLAMGKLEPNQLRVALAQQRRFGRRIGEILAWKGWVGSDVLEEALAIQVQLKQMQTPSAWVALQQILQTKPVVSEPMPEPLSEPLEIPIPPHLQSAQESNGSESQDPAPQRQGATPWNAPTPANQIAELELQLQIKEQEWKALTAQMEAQVKGYQQEYESRIQQLEARLEDQAEQIQIKIQQEVKLRHLEAEVERLEKGFKDARQDTQRVRRSLEQALAERDQERSDYATQLADLQIQIEAKDEDIQDLRQRLEAQTLENQVLRFQLDGSNGSGSSSEGGDPPPLSPLTQELENLREQIKTYQLRLQETQSQNEEQDRELKRLENMVDTYRHTIQVLQNSLQQQGSTTPPITGIHPTVLNAPVTAGSSASAAPVPLTPWARNLFNQLESAGLIDGDGVERVMTQWQQGGGRLTQVISQVTNLNSVTIRFFCDGGSVARQAGCRRLGDFLVAAGLLDQDKIKALRRDGIWDSLEQAQALVEQGILPQTTVDYFLTQFVKETSGPLNSGSQS